MGPYPYISFTRNCSLAWVGTYSPSGKVHSGTDGLGSRLYLDGKMSRGGASGVAKGAICATDRKAFATFPSTFSGKGTLTTP